MPALALGRTENIILTVLFVCVAVCAFFASREFRKAYRFLKHKNTTNNHAKSIILFMCAFTFVFLVKQIILTIFMQ